MTHLELIRNECQNKIKTSKLSADYSKRLEDELKAIEQMDRAEYILTMRDAITKGEVPKRKNINGLVFSHLLGITDIDPVKEDLPHNKYLSDPPDIDVDLSMEAKDMIEAYLIERHGQEHVAHIYTTSVFSPKSLIRTLCRCLDLTDQMKVVNEISDYFGTEIGEGNEFVKQIETFEEVKKNLSKATQDFLKSKPKYTNNIPRADKKLTCEELLFKYALKLSGQVQNTGKHASGIAISSENFSDFAPLKKVKGEILLALQEGGHAKEVSLFGCLKYDWLGLKNVSKTLEMFKLAKELYGVDLEEELFYKNNFDDKETLAVFDNAETLGIFQFASDGIREYLRRSKISSLNDIALINAGYRPGAMKYLDDLIHNMHNPETITYDHPDLEPVLKDSYGVIIYQEQVMQFMMIIGGFTGSEADKARSVLKKLTRNKKPDIHSVEYYEYKKMMVKFVAGAQKKGFSEQQAEVFVQVLASNLGYSFNKAHAIAYSINGYVNAYFKAHYPLVFYKVNFDHEDDKNVLMELFADAEVRGVKVHPFDINKTQYSFSIDKDSNEIMIGWNMIKGVQKKIIDGMMEQRDKKKFDTVVDFFAVLMITKTNKRTIEPMIELGAFDHIYPNRAALKQLYEYFQIFMDKKDLKTESKRWKFSDIFKKLEEHPVKDYTATEKIKLEFKYLDMYLFADPITYAIQHYEKVHGITAVPLSKHDTDFEDEGVIAAIASCDIRKTSKGAPYLALVVTDTKEKATVRVWQDKIKAELQVPGTVVLMKLSYQSAFNSYTLKASSIFNPEAE